MALQAKNRQSSGIILLADPSDSSLDSWVIEDLHELPALADEDGLHPREQPGQSGRDI